MSEDTITVNGFMGTNSAGFEFFTHSFVDNHQKQQSKYDKEQALSDLITSRAFFHNTLVNIIYVHEGGIHKKAYIINGSSESGVTIAVGVDLGQFGENEFSAILNNAANSPRFHYLENPYANYNFDNETLNDINSTLMSQFQGYFGLKGQDAKSHLNENPLEISGSHANYLSDVFYLHTYDKVSNYYKNQTGNDFDQLNALIRTVVIDVAYPYGPNLNASAPKFWGNVKDNDTDGIIKELRNWYNDDRPSPQRFLDNAYLLEYASENEGYLPPSYKSLPFLPPNIN
ncbi:pesticin C-terminus-like muramidase [Yersinia enterocolitica]|uniref:pesticin C-terminus-like muramidase n=1 Tax=Yersinia enterocolitica TaxID=630 RepID=UPI003D074469